MIEKQQQKNLKNSLSNLKANANLVKTTELNGMFTQRSIRVMSRENESNIPTENVDDALADKIDRQEEDRKAAIRGTSYSGNRRYGFGKGDRQKSVSKSIQR